MASFWVPRTGAKAFDYNPVFEANLPLPIHIERTIPLYYTFRNYFEIDNVFAN